MEPSCVSLLLVENKNTKADIRLFGGTRHMDLIMYVLYSNDYRFVCDMVVKVTREVASENACEELLLLTQHRQENLLLYKCLFFFMLNFHCKFRYWVINENTLGLQPVCPYKAARFLQMLRNDLIPKFLVNEAVGMDDFEHQIKIEYIRS